MKGQRFSEWRLQLPLWLDFAKKRERRIREQVIAEVVLPVRSKEIVAEQLSKLPDKDQIKSEAQARLEQAKETASQASAALKDVDPDEVKTKFRGRNALLVLLGLIALVLALYLTPLGGEKTPQSYAPAFSALVAGFVVGIVTTTVLATLWWIARKFGIWIALTLLFISPLIMIVLGDITMRDGDMPSIAERYNGGFGFLFGAGVTIWVLSLVFKAPFKFTPATKIPIPFGTSRWATLEDLENAELIGDREGDGGLFLGYDREAGQAIIYEGEMHGLTVAPTRTGKGATAIIPNLMRSCSSMLVIDPKGENARRSIAARRAKSHWVYVVDPWGIALEPDAYGQGVEPYDIMRYNPLAELSANDPDLASDTMLLADSLVIDSGNDPFWANEAKALLQGFMMYVVTSPDIDDDERHLGKVRDILSLPTRNPKTLPSQHTIDHVIEAMEVSDQIIVNQAAARYRQKADKERSSVVSMAQSSTHFLDSPKIRESLSRSSFSFKDLKTYDQPVTVYLVLPLDRLKTYNRWLRLLITSAMIDLTRVPKHPEKPPVRVILDEFAALDKLEIIETAFGTMAGMGVQLWVFTQDLGQLMRLYGDKAWQTFVSNAGVFQYFGSRDYETAKYAEHLCGMTTMKKANFSFGRNWSVNQGSSSGPSGGSSSSGSSRGESETVSWDDVSRPLAYADEMMTLHRDLQLLFIENNYPIVAEKEYYFRPKTSDAIDASANRQDDKA